MPLDTRGVHLHLNPRFRPGTPVAKPRSVTFAERARVAAVAGGLVALGGGAARAADPGIGLGLSFNAGPAVFQTLRTSYPSNLGTTDVDTTLAAAVSVAGTVSMGPVVAGLSVDGTYAGVNFPHAFAGGFLGAELKRGKVMVQLAAEGGAHDQFDVGGTSAGLVLDFTWWARGWFHPPPASPER